MNTQSNTIYIKMKTKKLNKKFKEGTSLEKIQSKIAELALRVEELENGI